MSRRLTLTAVLAVSLLFLVAGFLACPIQAHPPEQAAVPGEWQPQWTPAQSQTLLFENSPSIVMTPDGDLWASTIPDFDKIEKPLEQYAWLVRFTPTSGRIVTYTNAFEENYVFPLLFVSREGTLWLLASMMGDLQSGGVVRVPARGWVLRRYDPTVDQFVPVQDSNQVLLSRLAGGMTEDPQGNLWFGIADDAEQAEHPQMIRYNPAAGAVTRVTVWQKDKTEVPVAEMTCGPDGTLWMVAGNPARVIQYDPGTGAIVDHGLPMGSQYYMNSLFFGRTGRLWMTSIAWMDFPVGGSPQWHPQVQPKVFERDVPSEGKGYTKTRWIEPYWIYESSDSAVWFSSTAGLVRYDPQKDEWVKSAPFQSVVVEDKNGYLWAAANSQFYRYKLRP